jgi:hypothetical protein
MSALDTETEKEVFGNLLAGGGLLRRGDTTVVMATSAGKF